MAHRFSPLALLTPVAALSILAACSDSTSNNNNNPPTADISIVAGAQLLTNTAYDPDTIHVSLAGGGRLVWRNDEASGSAIFHTATANELADSTLGFATGNVTPGDTVSIDFSGFTANDTVAYHCTIHPTMAGAVIVDP